MTGRPVLISDLQDGIDERWPVFSVNARRTSARALYVLPLQVGAIKVGVIDLYRLAPGPLHPEELTGALRVADAALWTLLGQRDGPTRAQVGSLAELSDPPLQRAVVHQATGMVVVQAGVSAETALAMLRAYAFSHERPVDEVARDVVARRLRLEEESP